MPTFLALLGMVISVMLIGIILLQRGRGGGLVGALSGLGGQSAFGTKAGDTFTKITIVLATLWVLLAGVHGKVLRSGTVKFKNEVKEIGSPSKDKEKGAGADSKKSDDEKDDFGGLGTLTDEPKDKSTKAGDTKKPKTEKPVEDDKPDDSKKPETDDKKSDSDSKPKEPPKKELDDDKSGDKSTEKTSEKK